MKTKEKNKKELIDTGTEIVPMVRMNQTALVLEGDPEKQVEFAQKASRALMSVVESKSKKVMINGKRYLEFDDWQLVARFYGASVAVEWTKKLEKDGKLFGYEARANVLRNGEIIGSAEATCTLDEKNWKGRDEFAIKSMSQTRASAKALRAVFAWVVVMAGYSGTPAEEMSDVPKISDEEKQKKGLETLRKMLGEIKDLAELKSFSDNVQKSKKYTQEQKEELLKEVDLREVDLKTGVNA